MKRLYFLPLLFLCASLSAIDVYVSSGSFSFPYYTFYSDSNGNNELNELSINEEYTFYRLNEASSHPFYVANNGVNIVGSGSSSNGITGSQSFTISFNGLTEDDTLQYFCTAHSFMSGQLNLVSNSFPQIASSDLFESGQNGSYPYILVTTLKNIDFESSQLAQKIQINFTDNGLPAGAEYRIYRTTENGGNYTTGPFPLSEGTNTIDIPAVDFNRSVKLQFNIESGSAEFDQLAVNGVSLYGSAFPSEELLSIPSGSVSTSTLFTTGSNSGHPYIYESVNISDGSSSQDQQVFSLNITGLPADGATYRVYKTYNNGQGDLTSEAQLNLGLNTITVNSVSFDQATGRTVRLLISDHVALDEFSVNGSFIVGEDNENSSAVNPPSGSQLISEHFDTYSGGGNYEYIYTATIPSEGLASQNQQVFSLNVTALPDTGTSYSIYKTTSNGSDYFGPNTPLYLGSNIITVESVTFPRTVKLRLTSDVAVDELIVNGSYIVGSNEDELVAPVGSELASTYFDSVSSSESTYKYVYESVNLNDGSNSQDQQVFSFNITALPDTGASYSIYKTTINGSEYTSNPMPLELGANQITVDPVTFPRTVKIRLTEDIAIDELVINGNYIVGNSPSGPPAGSSYPDGTFLAGSAVSWPWVYTAATISEGESSQEAKTFVLNVTELPEDGAHYRIYKTTLNGSDYFSPANTLTIGVNKFTVPATSFDRAVKLQLSSGNIAFEYFGVNGDDIYGDPIDSDNDGIDDYNDFDPSDPNVQVESPAEAPSLSISINENNVTIQWSDANGFEIMRSNDLNTWTSTGDSQSPYIEPIESTKFYKLSNE